MPLGAAEALAGSIRTPPVVSTVLGTGRFHLAVDGRGMLARGVVLGKSAPASTPIPVGRRAKRVLVVQGTNMQDVFRQPTYNSVHRGPAELARYEVRYADGRTQEFVARYGDDIGSSIGRWPATPGGLCHRSVPVDFGTHTFYAQEWANPRPDVAIESIVIRVGRDATETGEVTVAAISLVE